MKTFLHRCFILFIALLLFTCTSLLSEEPTTSDKLDQAKSLFAQKDYTQAKNLLTGILDAGDNPDVGTTYLLLLKCHYFQKDHSSLEGIYSSYHSNFSNTIFDPAARFVRANSILDNRNDPVSAYSEYEYILKNFPESPYAAPGSLYKLGLINLERYKNYEEALVKFKDLIKTYPTSDYVSRSYLSIIKASSFVDDTDTMLSYYNKLQEGYPSFKNTNSEANLALADFYNNRVDDRPNAMKYYMKVINDYPDSTAYPLAALRAADLVPDTSINRSIELYKTILEKYPDNKNYTPWAQVELATCFYLKSNTEKAKEEFQKVSTITKKQKYLDKAQMYLNAIEDPESIDGYKVNAECGMKKLSYMKAYDESFWDYSILKRKYNESWFQNFLKDENISDKDKAGLEYDYCFALFQLDSVQEALAKAYDIIEKYPDVENVVKESKFMIAFIHRRMGKYQDAINEFQELLEDYPDIKYAARVLSEIAYCFKRTDDLLSSAQIYQYMAHRFKNTSFGSSAEKVINIILLGHDDIKKQLVELNSKSEEKIVTKLTPHNFIKQLLASLDKETEGPIKAGHPAGN